MWLYKKDKTTGHFSKLSKSFLAVLRFLALFILSVFLLKPLVKSINNEVEEPIVVLVQDNSESLVLGKDSNFIKTTYQDQLQLLESELKEGFEVRTFKFGNQVSENLDSLNFEEKSTDFSLLLDELFSKFSHRNLGAVIIASDGIYNKGSNPAYSFKKLQAPVYTIALGDTIDQKDFRIVEVAHNRLAYLGNDFPLEIAIEGKKCIGETTTMTIERQGNVIHRESFSPSQLNERKVVPVLIEAKKTGLQRYTVKLSDVSGEITYSNNKQDVFIDVLDSRQKILLLAASPHPDLAAIRSSIESNRNYEVNSQLISEFNGRVNDYSMVIFHQLPSFVPAEQRTIESFVDANVPSFFITGAQTNFTAFNKLETGYNLTGYRDNVNDVSASFSKGFSLFKVDDDSRKMFAQLPPLQVPFGEFESSPGLSNLLLQRVGSIETNVPLLSFNKRGTRKVGLLAGEGIWRWRMVQYLNSGSHEQFNSFFSKVVQFMANKDDKRQFRVQGKSELLENQKILFNGEVYNESYEPILDKEISMKITGSSDQEFDFTFSPGLNNYRLDVGRLPVDNYSWTAKVNIGGRTFVERGEFSVAPVQLEMASITADHQMLNLFAQQNGGEMIYPSEMNSLKNRIESNSEVVSISYERKSLLDLIELKYILFVLIILLSAEWLVRKYHGSY